MRVVVLSAGLLFADGLGLGDFSLLAASVYVLAGDGHRSRSLQRILHVRAALNAPDRGRRATCNPSTRAGSLSPEQNLKKGTLQ